MRDCYDESDFLINFGFIGVFNDMGRFIETFEEMACHPSHIDMHHGTAPEIEIVNTSSATGRWRMRFQLLETEKKLVQLMHGYYEDEYIKLDGKWKMKASKYTLLSNLLLNVEDDKLGLLDMGSTPGLVTEE
jgi:phosphatidylinositol kinase/protein kinase (PI-3  family)